MGGPLGQKALYQRIPAFGPFCKGKHAGRKIGPPGPREPEIQRIGPIRRAPKHTIYRDLVRDSYAELGDGAVTATNILTRLMRLSQLTGGFIGNDDDPAPRQISRAKLAALEDIIDQAVAEGKKLVVIARFVPEMSAARWIQCEEAISAYGFLGKHPTTGAPIPSPFVAMSQSFMKQCNSLWGQIYQVVRENSATIYEGRSPQDNVMEALLSARRNA